MKTHISISKFQLVIEVTNLFNLLRTSGYPYWALATDKQILAMSWAELRKARSQVKFLIGHWAKTAPFPMDENPSVRLCEAVGRVSREVKLVTSKPKGSL